MISSTHPYSGVENCNVIAASPIEVSGTGALTGIMMAYEKATGTTLNEDQKAPQPTNLSQQEIWQMISDRTKPKMS